MNRLLQLLILLGLALGTSASVVGAEAVVPAGGDEFAELVSTFNPALDPTVDGDPTNILANNSFINPASDIAKDAVELAWIAFLVFMPFLVIPEILLLIVIFKFRDRKDGRKAATFVHHNKLEIAWTAIPCLALVIVAFPSVYYLMKFDNPPQGDNPDDRLVVNITGKRFSWKYDYPDYNVSLGSDIALGPNPQETVVFEKDRVARLTFGSEDVNHNWSVPAFGVRKDCFPLPRVNYAWFTPDRNGNFEGQCYELCGAGHGLMMFNAVVVEKPLFDRWIAFQQNKDAAGDIAELLFNAGAGDAEAKVELDVSLAAYLTNPTKERIDSLRYWAAFEYETKITLGKLGEADDRAKVPALEAQSKTQRALLDSMIAKMVPTKDQPVAKVMAGESH